VEVTLSLLDLGSLSLLVGVNEPLEVVFLELPHIGVVLLLSNLDALVPPVQFLVHCHGLLHFVILKEDCLGAVELLVQDCQLSLDSEVLKAFLGYQFVNLTQIVSFSNVT
jgi:hypothetical protein